MIIKPEQWIRTDYGTFMSYDMILENYTMDEFLALHQNFTVRNTPRELIQEDDLVFEGSVPSIIELVMIKQKIFGMDYIDTDGFQGVIQSITKIYTLDPEDNYIKQYEQPIK